jgi:hypothetical protein
MELDSLIAKLYRNEPEVNSMEKAASDNFFSALRDEGQVEENPYENMSTAQLAELALHLEGQEKIASAGSIPEALQADGEDELEKIAFDMLGGQIMAHSMVHEFSGIKTAMAHGLCRVCKESPMNIVNSSICSACASE